MIEILDVNSQVLVNESFDVCLMEESICRQSKDMVAIHNLKSCSKLVKHELSLVYQYEVHHVKWHSQ